MPKLPRFEPFSQRLPHSAHIALPLKTVAESNNFDHWAKKHRRHADQKRTILLTCRTVLDGLKPPCSITLTRFSPRLLDKSDNLPICFKWILDAICELLTGDSRPGRADSHEGISVIYDQIKCGEMGIRIDVITF